MIRLPRALAAAAAALVLACSDKGGTPPPPPPGLTLTPVTNTGDAGSSLGVLDPSLAYAAGAGSGGLAYSSVPSQSSVHTRVAQSSDGGATWAFLADVNVASARTITTTDMAVCGAATCTGTWVHERSEERRVGKECRHRWAADHDKKKEKKDRMWQHA